MQKNGISQMIFSHFNKDHTMQNETQSQYPVIGAGKPASLSDGFRKKSRQAGLTLIEAVAFLAISGTVISGALYMYNSASNTQKGQTSVVEVQGVRAAVKSVAQAGSYGAGSLNAMLVSSGRLPISMTGSGANITANNGSAVTVTGASTVFHISYDTMEKGDCTALLAAATSSKDWAGYSVQDAAAAVGTMVATTGAVNAVAASTACTAPTTATVKLSLWSN